MERKANHQFRSVISADVSVSYGCDSCCREVEGCCVEFANIQLCEVAGFDPVASVLIKVSGCEDPNAADEVAEQHKHQKEESELL